MRVLWITNKLLGKMAEKHGFSVGGFGGWMEQAYDEIMMDKNIQLSIMTSGQIDHTETIQDSGVTYYLIPGGDAYSSFSSDNTKAQRCIVETIKLCDPDVIHIWGTESELGLAVLRNAQATPSVVYMQGVMRSVEQHYFDSVSVHQLNRSLTFYDIYKRRFPSRISKNQHKRTLVEQEIISRSGNVICDNDWCEAQCKSIFHNVCVFRQNLPIDPIFLEQKWNATDQTRLFTSSQYAPFKGFPVLLRALAVLKDEFPDIVLEVPGGWKAKPVTQREKLTYDTYSNMINRMIDDLGISDHVHNLGSLSRREMADKMALASVFVQASTVENHSSTLREAMLVGVPCVVSDVGCASEYVSYGKHGMLYRAGEAEMLAFQVEKLLKNPNLSKTIGEAGKKRIQEKYQQNTNQTTTEIYRKIISTGETAI